MVLYLVPDFIYGHAFWKEFERANLTNVSGFEIAERTEMFLKDLVVFEGFNTGR